MTGIVESKLPFVKFILVMMLSATMLWLALGEAFAADDCGGSHYHNAVEHDCSTVIGVGSANWSGSSLTEASETIDEISVSSMGQEWCADVYQIDWHPVWVSEEDQWIIGRTGSGGLTGSCFPEAFLVTYGGHIWSDGDLHSTSRVADHPYAVDP